MLSTANAIFVPSRCSSSCFLRWWHLRLWAAWIVRRNAPNGRALSLRAPRFAAGLFTEVGGDVVAFGEEEGAYRFLAACHMILSSAHCIPQFAAVSLVLTDIFHASDLLPKMRILFGAVLSLLMIL